MDSFLLGLASFIIVLVPLVIIHELGHFIAAKLAGITVLEFGLGFPPRAMTLFTRGDTIYTLNWLPIGGFVRPYGEDFVRPKTEEELAHDQSEIVERGIENPKSVFQAGPWERIFFMAAGPGINFIAALVLFIVVALVGQPYGRADVTIYDIDPDSVAASVDLQPEDVIVSVNGETVESASEFNRLIEENVDQPIALVINRDGELIDMTLTADAASARNVRRVYILGVREDSPAEVAGFETEDLIVAVDGTEIESVGQLQSITRAHEGMEMIVTVLRGAERLELPVTPVNDGEAVRMGINITAAEQAAIGVVAVNRDEETYTRALPLGEAFTTGVDEFVRMHRLMGQFLVDVINGDIGAEGARPVSPVGIGQIGGPIVDQSLDEGEIYPIVLFAALISISLAITNLLPIPGLDGGRILFVIIELVRGKPMEPEREGMIHFIGVMLLLGLILLTVVNDIVNPIDLNGLR